MKIGVIVDNELNNDIRVLREIEILREHGFEIFVLCFAFKSENIIPVSQIRITRIAISRILKNTLFFFLNTIPVYEWLWSLHIKRFIIKNSIDVLHVHDLYMSRASYYGIQKAKLKIPMILDLHENYPFSVTTYNWTKGFLRNLISRPYMWRQNEKEYLGYANRIIVLSSDFRDLLKSRYPDLPEETFVILPNLPDLSRLETINIYPAKNPFNNNYPVIFYYGVIAERRGVFDALKVFKDLVTENHFVNFLLIGPVDKKDKSYFSELLNEEVLVNRVHYVPWIDSSELFSYLKICDICIAPFHKNPQHESGVANKIYDYMLGGKPVIASNCKPQQELIEKHNCGLIFSNMIEFHDALIKLISDKELRSGLGKNGYEAVIKHYHSGIMRENLLLLYKSIT
jgi:glycosyltransferase involved in cell wall biosynthesis